MTTQEKRHGPGEERSRIFRMMMLSGFLALCFLVGRLGRAATMPELSGWYDALEKPFFQPPEIAFPIVWTILYAMMGFAAWRIWLKSSEKKRQTALLWFYLQLAVNATWSWVFFYGHSLAGGLGVIILLFVLILITLQKFREIDKLAGWALIPYLLWVGFASLLNASILYLNIG
jgi:tryptophan-rich sensory protein